MIFRDFHIHSRYGDGADTIEDIIRYAISKGIEEIGFSEHSYTSFDLSYCMMFEDIEKYNAEVKYLKEKYKDQIKIHLGIEQDYFAVTPTDGYEYVIGAVHYVKFGEDYIPIDCDAKTIKDAVEKYCDGDIYKFCEEYYATVAKSAKKMHPDIVAHVDLVTKFNEQEPMIDENNPRYVAAWKNAVDELLGDCNLFEINTGAITRGYRTTPYPSSAILNYLKSKGADIILSGDSHRKEAVCYKYEELYELSNKNRGADILSRRLAERG